MKIQSRRSFGGRSAQSNVSRNPHMQPFPQKPSDKYSEQVNVNRLNAHELFLRYTAEIIKEQIVYAR